MDDSIARERVRRLLAAVTGIADTHNGLAERRRAVLVALADEIQADCGVWSWGRGWPDSTNVVPVAVIDFGVNDRQRGVLMQWGLNAETDRTFRQPILKQMGSGRAATTRWQDIYTPDEWDAMPFMRSQLLLGGWSSWLHSVRYSDRDTWSNFFLLRGPGQTEFGASEAAIVDLVLAAIPWMHSTAEELLPPDALVGLTPRQKTVMLMLLEGLTRKAISRRLGITEDTVGDHVKSIYIHFQVGSVGQLAAQFLRGR
jgi:DNA-binding CsgD family transcriptional regulator